MNKTCKIFMGLVLVPLLFGVWSCGDSSKLQDSKPLPLAMDVPNPNRNIKKSKEEVTGKTVPKVEKAKIEFKIADSELDKRLAESPVTDEASCLEKVKPLEVKVHSVQRDGGMWGHIEQADLKEYSPIGMQLDSKVNKMMFSLRYICETAKGKPETDLARYVREGLEEKGEKKFREHLKLLGEAPEDIDKLINFGKFSQEIKNRDIDYSTVHRTILFGELYVNKYDEFAKNLLKENAKNNALPNVMALHDAVTDFIASDEFVAMSLHEDLQSPQKFPGQM